MTPSIPYSSSAKDTNHRGQSPSFLRHRTLRRRRPTVAQLHRQWRYQNFWILIILIACSSIDPTQGDRVRKSAGGWTTNWWTTHMSARRRMSSRMCSSSSSWNGDTYTPSCVARRPITLASTTTRRPTTRRRPTDTNSSTDNNNNNNINNTRSSPAFNSISTVSHPLISFFFFQGISFQSALLSAHLKRIHRADNLFFFFPHDRSGLRDYLAETELKCFSFFFDVTLGSRTRLHLVSIREKKKMDSERRSPALWLPIAYRWTRLYYGRYTSLSGRCV